MIVSSDNVGDNQCKAPSLHYSSLRLFQTHFLVMEHFTLSTVAYTTPPWKNWNMYNAAPSLMLATAVWEQSQRFRCWIHKATQFDHTDNVILEYFAPTRSWGPNNFCYQTLERLNIKQSTHLIGINASDCFYTHSFILIFCQVHNCSKILQ